MMVLLALPLTLVLYLLVRALYRRTGWPLINPVLIPALLIMGLLLGWDLPLADYQLGTRPITLLLEPAVVALALPLYQQLGPIRAKLKPILICCLVSVLISVGTSLVICHLLDIDPRITSSIATRSITTPLAMSVSQSLGGIPAIAAAIVVVVGILGAVLGFPLLKLFRVQDPQAQGLAIGACSHAVGTAAAAEKGLPQGAFSSLAMVVCGILTALVAPLLFALYGWLA